MSATADFSVPHELIEARRLAAQYGWRLLTVNDWVSAAREIDPTPEDPKAARYALLRAYAAVLFAACGETRDAGRREQAYRELYDYLWQQAYYWHQELACRIAQEAMVLVFRSFVEPGLKRCADPPAFLSFAHSKLNDARKRVYKEARVPPNWAPLPEASIQTQDGSQADGRELPDCRPGPEESVFQTEAQREMQAALRAEMETQAPAGARPEQLAERRAELRAKLEAIMRDERRRWARLAIPVLIAATLRALQELWRSRQLHRQLATVIHTATHPCKQRLAGGSMLSEEMEERTHDAPSQLS
jgi:hypothetical protein